MKIIFLAAVALLFIGFGCTPTEQNKNVSSSPTNTAVTDASAVETIPPTSLTEEKAWRLSFDLPADWVMTDGCKLQGKTAYCVRNLVDNYSRELVPELDLDIDPQADVVYLQNSKKIALFGGVAPNDTVKDLFQSENIVQIKVSTLDKAEIVPPIDSVKNEDLGHGFFKVTTCDIVTTPECEIYGQSSFEYYFVATSGNKYRFSFLSQDVSESVIQAVVLSAKE